MRSSLSLRPTLLPLLLLSIASSFGHAAVQNRISSVSSTAQVPLAHSIPRRALGGRDLGPVAAGLKLDSLMLTFNMTDAQQAALTQLLVDLQNPSSPRYHQWLTPEQFGAQFGLSAPDLAKVSSWLTSQGFTITGTARASNFITFSGTAAQVQQAFGTSIHNMMINGEQHISNVTDPVLPAGLASVVTNLSGLNDLKLKSRARTRVVQLPPVDTSGVHPNFTSSITGTHYIAPGDFYTIYNENPLISSSINGQGVTIAVMGQTDINLADVTAFRTASGLCTVVNATTCPTPLPTVMLYGTDPGTSQSDLPEAMLDVEWAGATAPNAKIIYVNSNNVISGSLVSAINNNLAPILSISYGDCEVNFGATFLTQFNQLLQQANAQGQTVVGPSGDSGATDCDFDTYPAVDGLAVDFPGSSPFATSAGGSMFNEGSGTYWNSNSSPSVSNAGSALSYIPEAVWNESSATNGLGAGGGGFSLYFSKPYWQVGSTVPQDFSRDVPDIALNAASNHDGTLYCVAGSCVNGTFRASDGQSLSVVGGTSVATPQFAGVLALVEQKIGSKIGNAGPGLYALANSSFYTSVFNDITTGNNTSACTAGTINCPAGGVIGYSAGVGYDQATGWGSVNVSNLANDWNSNQVTPIPIPKIGQYISVTTLSTTSPVCGVSNATLPLNINIAAAPSPTFPNPSFPKPSSLPTGTVQLLVDNVISGSPIALSSGSATFSFSTASLSSGSHNITALYSGDANYAASKGYFTTDVVSSSKPDFAFTPCTASTTVAPGGTAPGIAFTVAPVNGFTGTVTFSAISDDVSLAANYTFTPTTVTTSGTTNFVLFAFVTNATASKGLNKLHAANQEPIHAPWYVAGSGASLACVLLLVLPRRRRWGALLMVVLSVAILGAAGCGSSSSTTGGGGGSTTTPAAPGSYNIQVTASATTTNGLVSHSTTVLFTVH
jgi:Pro-kumamolisin, activation domain/Bacterial Ig-like domain (group 3)